MAANYNDNTNFANFNGQGSVNAVRGWQASASSIAIEIRGLFLCLGYWYALVLSACRPGMTPHRGDVSDDVRPSPPAPSALDVGRRRRPRHSRRCLTGTGRPRG